jgi:hypothetical protein
MFTKFASVVKMLGLKKPSCIVSINQSINLFYLYTVRFKARSLWGCVFTPYTLHTTFNILQHTTLNSPCWFLRREENKFLFKFLWSHLSKHHFKWSFEVSNKRQRKWQSNVHLNTNLSCLARIRKLGCYCELRNPAWLSCYQSSLTFEMTG